MSSGKGSHPLSVGLIGAGMIGQMRARALAKIPGEARLVAVADLREDLAGSIAGKGVGIRVHADGAKLARDPDVEAVLLCTPPSMHESLGVQCMRSGKHVLCEKPLAPTVEQCERMVRTAEESGVCLATGFTLRQTPAARLARRLVDEGAIGELDHIRAFHGHGGGKAFGPAWITDRAQTGGGTLMDNGIHMIDLARWFLGDIRKVSGFGSNHTWKFPGCEDNGFVLMRSSRGKMACVHGSWTEWRGYSYRMELYGSRGFIRFGFPPLRLTHGRGEPGHKMKSRHHVFPIYQILERLMGWQWSLVETLVGDLRDWVGAIRNGNPAPSSGRDGLEAVRIARSIEFP